MNNEKILEDEFFKELNVTNLETILDPLTKVLSRRYISDYIHYLIENNVPFSAQIIDLDNFKLVNDNYGHQAGDAILIEFAKRMKETIGERGFVGRFGGDEFMVILPYLTQYDDVHKFIADNYFGEDKPFRTKYRFERKEIFVTGTIGSASFPFDALDYDSFFKVIDKALYRGKEKGRNCYIIYVEAKHKYINANSISKITPSEMVNDIFNILEETEDDLGFELLKLNEYFKKILKISSLEYFKNNEVLGKNIDTIFNNKKYFFTNHIKNIEKTYPTLYEYLEEDKVISFLIYKFRNGYLMFTEKEIQRIWQDEHIVLLMILSKILSYNKKNKTLN